MRSYPASRSSYSRTQRCGSWLSLFAMLMIFVGPLISQSMPMDHRASMLSMDMSMDMGNGMHHAMPEHAGMDHGGHHPPGAEMHALWEACGYCTLLFSCPALPQNLSFVALEGLRPASQIHAQPLLGHARSTIFPGARSRAPPVLG